MFDHELLHQILRELRAMAKILVDQSAAIARLTDDVANETTVDMAILTLVSGQADQIRALAAQIVAEGTPPDDAADALNALADTIEANSARLAAAVAANTTDAPAPTAPAVDPNSAPMHSGGVADVAASPHFPVTVDTPVATGEPTFAPDSDMANLEQNPNPVGQPSPAIDADGNRTPPPGVDATTGLPVQDDGSITDPATGAPLVTDDTTGAPRPATPDEQPADAPTPPANSTTDTATDPSPPVIDPATNLPVTLDPVTSAPVVADDEPTE